MTGAWFGGLALAAAACSFSADFGGGHFRCQGDGDCPDGITCAAGFCGGGGMASDGSASDGPVASACPGDALLVDDFDGNELDLTRWDDWMQGTAMIGQAGGRLDITANGSDAGAGVFSDEAPAIDESSLVVEVITPEDYSSSTMGVELILEGSTTAVVTLCRDNFDLFSKVGDNEASIEFSPDKHRFWRIDEVGNQVRFFTSADGSVWMDLFAASAVDLPVTARLSLWGQNYDTAAPLVLSFGSATWCKMSP